MHWKNISMGSQVLSNASSLVSMSDLAYSPFLPTINHTWAQLPFSTFKGFFFFFTTTIPSKTTFFSYPFVSDKVLFAPRIVISGSGFQHSPKASEKQWMKMERMNETIYCWYTPTCVKLTTWPEINYWYTYIDYKQVKHQ